MNKKINRLLVANRGEIAIRILRAASELIIKTVSVYTYEDRFSPHRFKADEAYQIGSKDDPLKPYLDVKELIAVCKRHKIDAVHPGYGFLSENVAFATACRDEGIIFIGPDPQVMAALGDKVIAKKNAVAAGVPVIENSKQDLTDYKIALDEATRIGYPLMIKAASGGGGRGMRVIHKKDELKSAFNEAKSEAGKAFGDDTVFLEKFITSPRHIEIQILADNHGNRVHLYERDCSVQRRFQKVVEVAPASNLKQQTKDKLYQYALKIADHVNYNNAGTVEFLLDQNENIYFIEVNPRVQVEHTITEEVTGIDIVRSQIHIASGYKLSDPQIGIQKQDDIHCNGYAIQCRVTTEDPKKGFQPDYGTIIAYRSTGGFGIRLDVGAAYNGAIVSPVFDSLLVKVSSWGRTLEGATQRLDRALREFRIRGVKTNIGFLQNVIEHDKFQTGLVTVDFIDNHPELFIIKKSFDRATKTLRYLANVTINGNPDVKNTDKKRKFRAPTTPKYDKVAKYPKGSRDILINKGADGLVDWIKQQDKVLITDTTLRDAHQSLLATRLRTEDMLPIAEGYAKNHSQIFSLEMWGGATFDVAMRFLHECPWARLKVLRKFIPNILFQMLFRGSNAVGYKAYPDNLIASFIEKSYESGIDIFRIFDSLNWIKGMEKSIKYVRKHTGGIAEGTICYTGDVLNTSSDNKYNMKYYTTLAKQLENAGAHTIAIKDMAGLLKPYAAGELIATIKDTTKLPIHLHTHDTSSIQAATLMQAVEQNVDIIDASLASMSGLTSQPNLNSTLAMLQDHPRGPDFDIESLNQYSNYFEDVREYYYPFESGLKAGTAQVYDHEIPGGQYSNLRPQAISLGLEHKFEKIKQNYAEVNKLFGDIVKVTPSSKVVGDMAMFMTANNLKTDDMFDKKRSLSYPESVLELFRGDLGQPVGGFPSKISKAILKDETPYTERPNDHLEPVDFDKELKQFHQDFDEGLTFLDFLSYKMYPAVFKEYYQHVKDYGPVTHIPTKAFFYGMKINEEIRVKIGTGKVLIVKLKYYSQPDEFGIRIVNFDLNGLNRSLEIQDLSIQNTKKTNKKATEDNQIGSPLQGKLSTVLVKEGDSIKKGETLFVIEAMKMETNVSTNEDGKVKKIHINEGVMVNQDDMVIELF
ncbi:MAG: pyruvate carboxylase [Gammaproteobacteria bacterium]|nr:MAG: pyruvate carboxylase [Gammaproteobacteria bacterium]